MATPPRSAAVGPPGCTPSRFANPTVPWVAAFSEGKSTSCPVAASKHRARGVRARSCDLSIYGGGGGGGLIDKGYLYKPLNNRTYLGMAVHRGTAHPGEHAAIIDRKGNRLYRYYVSQDVLKRGPDACPVGRVPAAEIEAAVIDQLRGIFRQPEIIVGTWRAARAEQDDITEDEAREALLQLDPLWDELFPAEQARIVQLLVERVDVRMHGVEVRLRPNGLAGLVREVAGSRRAAA